MSDHRYRIYSYVYYSYIYTWHPFISLYIHTNTLLKYIFHKCYSNDQLKWQAICLHPWTVHLGAHLRLPEEYRGLLVSYCFFNCLCNFASNIFDPFFIKHFTWVESNIEKNWYSAHCHVSENTCCNTVEKYM